MVNAIRIHTIIDSENLRIPELIAFIGKRVEIIVVEDNPASTAVPRPVEPTAQGVAPQRILGSLRGQLHVPDDFNDPLPEDVLRAIEGDA